MTKEIPEHMRVTIELFSTGDEGHVMTQKFTFTGTEFEHFEKMAELAKAAPTPGSPFTTNPRWMTKDEIDQHLRDEEDEDDE